MSNIVSSRNIGTAEIQIVIGDIANQPDMAAIVNASNTKLRMGSGVSGAIFRAAGIDKLTQACTPLAPIEVGMAVITPGFNLPNRFIIHCCGPQYEENSDDKEKLVSCYRNTLSHAESHEISSLAIPAISTGVHGFPIDQATRICINTIKEFSPNFDKLKIIRFVVSDETTANIYTRHLQEEIPIPKNAVKVVFNAHFSQAQFLQIRKGYISGCMECKWYFYFDDPWLYIFYHDRRDGVCHWFLKFQSVDIGFRVTEAWNDRFWEEDKQRIYSLYWLLYDYLLDESQFAKEVEFDAPTSSSYYVLQSGRVKLNVSSEPLFVDEVRNLGLQLIQLADKLNTRQLQEKSIHQDDLGAI